MLRAPEGLSTARLDGKDLRLYRGVDGGLITFCFAADLVGVNSLVDELTRAHLKTLPVVLIVAMIGGWWLARQALQPVKSVADAVDSIRPEDLSTRLKSLSQDDEIGRLTEVFNRMIERLEGGFQQATRFSADASHELRTPLTVLHAGLADLLGEQDLPDKHRDAIADLQLQTLGLISTMNSLLLLARADAGRLQLKLETADFAEIMTECVEDARIVQTRRACKLIACRSHPP